MNEKQPFDSKSESSALRWILVLLLPVLVVVAVAKGIVENRNAPPVRANFETFEARTAPGHGESTTRQAIVAPLLEMAKRIEQGPRADVDFAGAVAEPLRPTGSKLAKAVGRMASGLSGRGGLCSASSEGLMVAVWLSELQPPPIPLADRVNTSVERLSERLGRPTLRYYHETCRIMARLERDLDAIARENSGDKIHDQSHRLGRAQKRLYEASEELKGLKRGDLGDRVDEETLSVIQGMSSGLGAAAEQISQTILIMQTIEDIKASSRDGEGAEEKVILSQVRSIYQLPWLVRGAWGPDQGAKRRVQEWLMDRYGIDTSKGD